MKWEYMLITALVGIALTFRKLLTLPIISAAFLIKGSNLTAEAVKGQPYGKQRK
jgi:hypothetical protein